MTLTLNQNKKKTRKERRIEILKDALARLRYRDFKFSNGYLVGSYLGHIKELFSGTQLQKQTKQLEKNCQVCALGGLFISSVDKFNNLKVDECDIENSYIDDSVFWIDRDVVENKLLKYFSQLQLDMIESAFETRYLHLREITTHQEDLCYKAIDFGRRYSTPKERMRAILKNALKNDGIFKP